MARVLVAGEYSGVVRDAFRARGHDAISCDLLPTERPGPHIQGDVLPVLREPWDLVVAHPPCQRLSSLFWTRKTVCDPAMLDEIPGAIHFFKACLNANAPLVAVENPTMHSKAKREVGSASCVIQPWQFGHPYTKRTLLWLKGLPPLMPTEIISGPYKALVDGNPKQKLRSDNLKHGKDAALTFPGIAEAMADQWGAYL